jgi:uncharacterized membrane protein
LEWGVGVRGAMSEKYVSLSLLFFAFRRVGIILVSQVGLWVNTVVIVGYIIFITKKNA